jgi:hypothetical protein
MLKKKRLIMMHGSDEMGEIRYINISKNAQGMEEIEVQGRFITWWIGKRVILKQIVATDTTQNILTRIVTENVTNPAKAALKIPNIYHTSISGIVRGNIEYTSEMYTNALLACETAAKASKLGFRIYTDIRASRHYFQIYDGLDLTASQSVNPPCIFSHEFDNIAEQEYINSIENLRTTAYVGGEELQGAPRRIVEVGSSASGLDRDEVYINATDITQTYKNASGQDVTMTNTQYDNMLLQRGVSELETYTETLAFSSKINANSNLKYKGDYNLGDRVTCLNKRWGIIINARITEITEIYQNNTEEINITFGESLPSLIGTIRQAMKTTG